MEDTAGVFLRHLYLSAAMIDVDGMIGHIQHFHGLLREVKFEEIQSNTEKIQILIIELRQRHPTALFLVLDYLLANGFRTVADSISYDMTRWMLSLEERNQSGLQNVVVQTVPIDGHRGPAVESANGEIVDEAMEMGPKQEGARIIGIGGEANGKAIEIEIFHPTNSSVPHYSINLVDFVTVRGHQCHLIYKNQVLIIGGMVDEDDLQHQQCDVQQTSYLNLNTFAVRPGPSLPKQISLAASSSLNGIPYICGGATTHCYKDATAACYKLMARNRKWVGIGSLNIARFRHTMSALNGRLYAIGGRNAANESLKSVECYDRSTDKWIQLGSQLNDARKAAASLVHHGKIWVTGGDDHGYTTEVFDPITETWSYGPRLNQRRFAHSMVKFCGKMYVIGGGDSQKTMEVFNDDSNKWEIVDYELNGDYYSAGIVVK